MKIICFRNVSENKDFYQLEYYSLNTLVIYANEIEDKIIIKFLQKFDVPYTLELFGYEAKCFHKRYKAFIKDPISVYCELDI